ncbi:helix-turn-helix domain-containing protein [Ureaplasma parvum]|uniref:helix-turn-helix domain-containing protein n=1 Tax=Ureaplasma parvum TaxID=134821 RepID=UPI002FE0A321
MLLSFQILFFVCIIPKIPLAKLTLLNKSTIAKLSKEENINTEMLKRICIALKVILKTLWN